MMPTCDTLQYVIKERPPASVAQPLGGRSSLQSGFSRSFSRRTQNELQTADQPGRLAAAGHPRQDVPVMSVIDPPAIRSLGVMVMLTAETGERCRGFAGTQFLSPRKGPRCALWQNITTQATPT